jgi:RNA polymerase sigma factor (TIGR02999 family)
MEKDITTLLGEVGEGDARAMSELWERIAPQVRAMAARQLRHPPRGQRLGASTVVNEVYGRLFPAGAGRRFDSRAHLLGSAARTVRHILVEHARAKRLGRIELDLDALPDGRAEASTWAWEEGDLEALDRALRRFEADPDHERKARIVHLRFFVGCPIEEIAALLELSRDTVNRDLRFARAWLQREIKRGRPR